MIDPKELRIGNLVEFNGYPVTISGICGLQVTVDDSDWLNISNNISPIPLTPDILERAGFKNTTDKKRDLNIHYTLTFKGFTIEFEIINTPAKWPPYCHLERIGLDIGYLHQLQNLYYSLTSQELNIKP